MAFCGENRQAVTSTLLRVASAHQYFLLMDSMIHSLFPNLLEISLFAYQLFIPEGTLTYHENVKKMFQMNVFENTYTVDSLACSGEQSIGEYHQKIAEYHRTDIHFTAKHIFDHIRVENCLLFGGSHDIPIFFVDEYVQRVSCFEDDCECIYGVLDSLENGGRPDKDRTDSCLRVTQNTLDPLQPQQGSLSSHGSGQQQEDLANLFTSMDEWEEPGVGLEVPKTVVIDPLLLEKNEQLHRKVHIVVLVHGYQGSAFDLTFLKNNLMFLCDDDTVFHCSTINQSDSSKCIDELGLNLANEVRDFAKATCPLPEQLLGLSFIGHSLGGLIIRAALPRLAKYKLKMQSLVTFGTPHLGCTNLSSVLVKSGMKVWLKVSQHVALKQMIVEDAADIRDSFLMSLSSYEVRAADAGDGVVREHPLVLLAPRLLRAVRVCPHRVRREELPADRARKAPEADGGQHPRPRARQEAAPHRHALQDRQELRRLHREEGAHDDHRELQGAVHLRLLLP